jgi:hypothetical protein
VRNRDAAFFCYVADGVRELAFLHLHDKAEDVSPFAAAKAVINLANRMDVERGSFLGVEGAQTSKIQTSFLQLNILADNAHDVGLLFHFVRK